MNNINLTIRNEVTSKITAVIRCKKHNNMWGIIERITDNIDQNITSAVWDNIRNPLNYIEINIIGQEVKNNLTL